jgi:PIN domain nuclease of toxin-antitoxin system
VWLWLLVGSDRLPAATVDRLSQAEQLALSAASVWEVVIKASAGKLELPRAVGELVTVSHRDAGITPVPVDTRHALAVRDLPDLHGDPFDRVLVAQALVEQLTLVTADAKVQAYDVPVLPV